MCDEQVATGGLVLMSGPRQLRRVDHLADVVAGRSEEHLVTVDGKVPFEPVDKLPGHIVYDPQVSGQPRRRVEGAQQVGDVGRQLPQPWVGCLSDHTFEGGGVHARQVSAAPNAQQIVRGTSANHRRTATSDFAMEPLASRISRTSDTRHAGTATAARRSSRHGITDLGASAPGRSEAAGSVGIG